MRKLERWYWKAVLASVIGAFVLWIAVSRLLFSSSTPESNGVTKRNLRDSSLAWPLAGAGSCSARGCHGSVEPAADPARCRQDEYARWTHDRHADAYRVLFDERSRNMVRLLGSDMQAHEDPRCLACHTNPLLAALPAANAFVQEERLFGVGCESCHGSANEWLVPHTSPDWRAKKRSFKMPDLTDPTIQAKTCVGCHVGAPHRDVNHDLIAAGHPRLNFEFGSYLANMPAHWRPRKTREGHLWAVGQLVSAEAALELLVHRAKAGPWPEFAEYDCFACHHALAQPGWRQGGNRAGRKPGALAWGSWYFALAKSFAPGLPELHGKDGLEAIMQRPLPARGEAAAKAQAVLRELQQVHVRLVDEKNDLDDHKRLLALVKDARLDADPNWDGAEQMYLALHALNQTKPNLEVVRLLTELTPMRAFPPGMNGPIAMPRDGHRPFNPRDFMDRLKHLR